MKYFRLTISTMPDTIFAISERKQVYNHLEAGTNSKSRLPGKPTPIPREYPSTTEVLGFQKTFSLKSFITKTLKTRGLWASD